MKLATESMKGNSRTVHFKFPGSPSVSNFLNSEEDADKRIVEWEILENTNKENV